MPKSYIKSTQFPDVCSRNGGKSWTAYLTVAKAFPEDIIAQYGMRKQIHLGTFDTEEQAAHAHDV